ncbi:hypothetical protein J5N97_030073 [Dioscorea zingiberensis]|uniref:HP domain-containing protein n=1 Tax=Dioscorea zingiberensis TaxID=325984 RepID=A0A9D5BX41_9LILI|nr:hypothetical protein J5N97_030073 [Dioscorea zingiberensis]
MAVSMRDVDSAFHGAGQKPGIEIWRIENFQPAPVPKSSYGNFFTGDAYLILKTTSLRNGAIRHDIHYWLGKDTTQDEAGTAAIKTVELDAALGGRAVQYREVQGHETEKFLSYFKPCIFPQTRWGGIWLQVPFARSSLNHDDIFILDTDSKIFQFNGLNSSIQERAKALEVVQFIKDTYHDGKCEVAAVDDGKLMADAEAGEFWGYFGGFAPLPRKPASEIDKHVENFIAKLLCVNKGQLKVIEADKLTRKLLDTYKCYLLDCGVEVFVWMGRNTSLDERKAASSAAEDLLREPNRQRTHVIRIIEGFETVMFRSKFDVWPQTTEVGLSEDARGKVAALLKRQGFNVKGLNKATPVKEEPQPYIDCTGNLQVWRVNGKEKTLLSTPDVSKFYSGDCYVFQYTYPGEDKEEHLVGTWFGKKSILKRTSSILLSYKMVESLKFQAAQARIYEGKEPVQFFSIFQSFTVFKGGLSSGYINFLKESDTVDDTYSEEGLALFRVQGSGPDNMQAIQVEPVASSLNSSYCYILHSASTLFTWTGSLTTPEDQELVERQLDVIKPNIQSRTHKREGTESEHFWSLLGGKCEYPSRKVSKEPESDPHLFSCTFLKVQVTEIFHFTQDDLMTEDIFILDCHSDIFVWVGQHVDLKNKLEAFNIGEKYLECDFLLEKLSRKTPIFCVMEGNEPPFFTRFFTWDSAKATMHGNSFQRKLAIVKNGVTPTSDKPRRRTPTSYGGRSSVPDKSQRSRSMSFSPDRVRVRGRSPAFNALAANFENPNARNLSTPPPVVRKIYPKSFTPDSIKLAPRSTAIAKLTASFEQPKVHIMPKSVKVSSDVNKLKPAVSTRQTATSMSTRIEALTIQEDLKEDEAEDEEGLIIFPYDRVKITSTNPVSGIDVTKRETYLSSIEFKEKFGMTKETFYKLPKWRQNKLKLTLELF